MIDLFAIFGKGGIVLWCFQGTTTILTPSINALIRNVFLEERGSTSVYQHDGRILKFKLDNEFDLVFVVVYSNVVQLSYTDKLIGDVHREFRDAYKNILEDPRKLCLVSGKNYFAGFEKTYGKLVRIAQEDANKTASAKTMRGFETSAKSQKTVASMIIQQPGDKAGGKGKGTKTTDAPAANNSKPKKSAAGGDTNSKIESPGKSKKGGKKAAKVVEPEEKENEATEDVTENGQTEKTDDDGMTEIERNRLEFIKRMTGGNKPAKPKPKPVEEEKPKKKVKENRKWKEEHKAEDLDYSSKKGKEETTVSNGNAPDSSYSPDVAIRGSMKGNIRDIDEEDSESEEEEQEEVVNAKAEKGGYGFFSAFKSLVGNKKLSSEDIQPALDKMKDHLIGKNVAAEIADKLCQSVATQLEGKVIGTFSGVAATVKSTLRESLVQLLSPHRRVDILRDIEEAKQQKRPYTVVFCGVNGVGKSTNLAKITFWLTENGHRVMIAACDTFRAGAVEQLRTHCRHLNALHPNSVNLYDQGYGKDAAGVAAQAIAQANTLGIDVVLVDTAGRMQDNEPLMRALSKLIKVNSPDRVLFVGEALVGNEAVDQLSKFNQALSDHSTPGVVPRLIDGIVLTKFDTIDDKVGAAVSMTYITGQPIVFVGTGQTYKDLKNLNANAVVASLLK